MFASLQVSCHLYWYLGRFEQALYREQQSIQIAREAKSPHMVFYAKSHLALTQAYLGRNLQALETLQEIDFAREKQGILVEQLWVNLVRPFAYLHAGQYENAWRHAQPEGMFSSLITEIKVWVMLTRGAYSEAVKTAEQLIGNESLGAEWRAKFRASLAYANFRSGGVEEARQQLISGLQSCLQIHAFLPLMRLVPIVALFMAEAGGENQKVRAIEIWSMAQGLDFIENSKLFQLLIGEPLEQHSGSLPQEIEISANIRGKDLDWWSTAESLIDELRSSVSAEKN